MPNTAFYKTFHEKYGISYTHFIKLETETQTKKFIQDHSSNQLLEKSYKARAEVENKIQVTMYTLGTFLLLYCFTELFYLSSFISFLYT